MDSVTHFSHRHPLHLLKQIPTDEKKFICFACHKPLLHQENNRDVYGCELCETFFLHKFSEDDIDNGDEILCDACIEPIISPPYYHCAECRYFLHLTCAKLPQQLQHPSHPHLLTLTSKTRFYEEFKCDHCKKYSNGFYFYCETEDCKFNLDLKCAALPDIIMHEFHNHPLFQLSGTRVEPCRGCGQRHRREDGLFGCEHCHFNLDIGCLLLRKTIQHKHDSNHPLVLRYPPHAYHPEPFDCYECETEIDPNFWLYHCEECDLSFHVECFNPSVSVSRGYVKFGQKVQIGYHEHPLKYVYEASVESSSCHHCDRGYGYYTFECETCNFRLCQDCFPEVESL